MTAPQISILLPVRDGWESTLRTLRALLAAARGVACETIVLDDASADETRQALPLLAGITAARCEERVGPVRSLAAGAGAAAGRHLLFLAQGVEPAPGSIAPLLAALEADRGLAAVGPVLERPSGAIDSAGVGVAYAAPLPLTPFPLDHGAPPAAAAGGRVAALSGACLLVRAEALAAAGGLDEGYAEAFWDVDLSLRLAAGGGRLAVVREARARLPGQLDWSDLGRHADDLFRLQRTWTGRFDAFTVDRRRTDRPVAPRAGRAALSVIVPTRDAIGSVASLLEDVALNLAPGDEIVVADCGSIDGTAEYADAFARAHPGRTRVVRCARSEGLRGAARAGLRASARPFAVVSHTGVSLAPGFLDDAAALLARHPGPHALALPMPGSGIYAAGPSELLRGVAEAAPNAFFADAPDELAARVAERGATLLVVAAEGGAEARA